MGAGASKEPPPPPLGAVRPVGLYPQFAVHSHEMNLNVLRKFGGDYSAKDAVTGQQVFSILSKAFSFSNKKEILDAHGQPIISLETRSFTIHPKIDGFDARPVHPGSNPSTPVLKVEFTTRTTANIIFRDRCNPNGVGADVMFRLDTNRLFTKGTVYTAEGVPIARIMISKRKSRETHLTIAPGADSALLTAICIILKVRNIKRGSKNASTAAMVGNVAG